MTPMEAVRTLNVVLPIVTSVILAAAVVIGGLALRKMRGKPRPDVPCRLCGRGDRRKVPREKV